MVEVFGLFASMVVIASFLFNNPKKIRIVNCVGGVLFLIYGIFINSISTIVLQSALIVIQIAKLLSKKKKENSENKYLK